MKKGLRTTAFDLGHNIKGRVTTQRRWWQWSRIIIGVEVWIFDPKWESYGYYVWKPTL